MSSVDHPPLPCQSPLSTCGTPGIPHLCCCCHIPTPSTAIRVQAPPWPLVMGQAVNAFSGAPRHAQETELCCYPMACGGNGAPLGPREGAFPHLNPEPHKWWRQTTAHGLGWAPWGGIIGLCRTSLVSTILHSGPHLNRWALQVCRTRVERTVEGIRRRRCEGRHQSPGQGANPPCDSAPALSRPARTPSCGMRPFPFPPPTPFAGRL